MSPMKLEKKSSDSVWGGPETWGPEKYGINLIVDQESSLDTLPTGSVVAMDVEDDEHDGFVGIGLYCGSGPVLYFTQFTRRLTAFLEQARFVAHNGKYDLHQLRKWSVNVRAEQLVFDTMLASYVIDSTKESHGLKELAKSLLGITYPSYKELTGKGRGHRTLLDIPVDVVSAYNALDCICTYRLWQLFEKTLSQTPRQYLETLELPVTRLLFDMESEGVLTDAQYLRELDDKFALEIGQLTALLGRFMEPHRPRVVGSSRNKSGKRRKVTPVGVNVNSTQQIQSLLLHPNGIPVKSTSKEALAPYEGYPIVRKLARYREIAKLRSTYTQGLLSLRTLPRVCTTFNQVSYDAAGDRWGGIRSGRLSSSNPNLQNIPTRTETGNLLRRAFVSRPGYTFVDADYSQIEWRIAASFSGDKKMQQILIEDRDIYDELAAQTGAPRRLAKQMALAMNYNAGAFKVAEILKTDVEQARHWVEKYKESFPAFFSWKAKVSHDVERVGHIRTLFGRQIKIDSHALAVPYLIQGSAAEIIKKAMLNCTSEGFRPVLSIHDELLFELPEDTRIDVGPIKRIMEAVVRLDVPLVAEVGIGRTWAEAKA